MGIMQGETARRKFEAELRAEFGCRHCFLTSSGKAAFTMILRALKERFPERIEVIVPSFTCYSVPSAIVRAGLHITIWDVCPDTLDFDYKRLPSSLQGGRTGVPLCVVPTHLFGIPTDLERLRKTLGDRDIAIIEDAAQAMGGEWRGKKLGTLGDAGFFSLGRGKALSTGEGGVIVTDDPRIGSQLQKQFDRLSDYGIVDLLKLISVLLTMCLFLRPSFFWLPKMLPFLKLGDTLFDPDFKMRKMHPFQARLARGWRQKLTQFQRIRSANTRRWVEFFQDRGEQVLPDNGDRPLPLIRFPLTVNDREKRSRVLNECSRAGLGVMPSYPESIAKLGIDGFDPQKEGFSGGQKLADTLITLPVHPLLSSRDAEQIMTIIGRTV